jgi:hypothetical protein
MNADVRRAYNPTAEYKQGNFYQKTIANMTAFADSANGVWPHLLRLNIQPNLVHRKIWVWLHSISVTFSVDADLVLRLNGTEKYRQRFTHFNSAAVNDKWVFGLSSSGVTATNEQLVVTIANTTVFGIAPHRLNIACDEAYIDVISVTGAAANFDGGLHIHSQAGI